MAAFEYIDLGKKIEEILAEKHVTKADLADEIGMSQSNSSYLTRKKSIDVVTLHKIGVALNYNFFKHYPIAEPDAEKNKPMEELQAKVAALQKQLDEQKKENEMLKKEIGYVNEINGLLKRNLPG